VGLCGLDRRRSPLQGTEHRGCWEPATQVVTPARPPEPPARDSVDPAVARLRPDRPPRTGVLEGFVPIELAGREPRTLQPIDPAPLPPPAVIEAIESWADRETLFGERET